MANSHFSVDTICAAIPRLRAKCTVVPNPVPGPERPEPARSTLSGPVELLYLGRLSPRKGPHVAVTAAAELIRAGQPTRLTILGAVFPGYEWYEAELQQSVRDLDIVDHVNFVGFADDVWSHLAAADVVVVPSVVDEPFGNTAVEATLAARPVVASASGGLVEATAGFGSARTVPPDDASAIAEAVGAIVADWSSVRTQAAEDADEAAIRHARSTYGDRLDGIVSGLIKEAA